MPVLAPLIPILVPIAIIIVAPIIIDEVLDLVFGDDEPVDTTQQAQEAAVAARARALLVNKNSNNAGIPLIYGQYRLGGTRVYIETSNGNGSTTSSDADNEYFNCVISLCEGQMGIPKKIYFDDVVIWNDDASGSYSESGGAYTLSGFESTDFGTSGIDIVYHDGRDDQTVDSMMSTSAGSDWGTNHRLRGVAYLSIKLKANAEVYAGGLPVFTAEILGKKIPDVSNTDDDDTSITYVTASADQNPVDCIYDYLTNTVYGKGFDHKPDGTYFAGLDIDLASFKQARLDCAAAWSGAGIEFNGTLSTEQKLYENIKKLVRACNGMLIFSGGKYRLIIQKQDETPALVAGNFVVGKEYKILTVGTTNFTLIGADNSTIGTVFTATGVGTGTGTADPTSHLFSEDNIIGDITISKGQKANKINKVTAGFTDAATNYIDNIVITKTGEDGTNYLATDNGIVLEASTDHQLTTNAAFIARLNEYRIDRSRKQMSVEFKGTHKALTVECGDIIKITQDALSWSDELFRVVKMEINEENQLVFSAIEYNSSIQI